MISFKQHSTSEDIYSRVGVALNALGKSHNYQVAPAMAKGKPGKNVKTMREYRMQLIDKKNDTSGKLIPFLKSELESSNEVSNVRFNQISPNSSKFPSFTFTIEGKVFDIVIARGANKGENFEAQTVKNLGNYFNSRNDKDFATLIDQMNKANPEFASVEIASVKQRTGSTKKEGIAIEKLGAIIGDIVLTDTSGHEWFISLKDVNGDTFSSYSGAASLFDSNGNLKVNSEGAAFLNAFGVDLNKVQQGFDERKGFKLPRPKVPVQRPDQTKMKAIFQRAWGMNYFYVKRMPSGWKVFWLDREKLNMLSSAITVTYIAYPSPKSKQITISAQSGGGYQKYKIEIRNSKAGEYPNDIKFKVVK